MVFYSRYAQEKNKKKISRVVIFVILFYLVCLGIMSLFNPSYSIEREYFDKQVDIPNTKNFECFEGRKYEYFIEIQKLRHNIDWGIIDKIIYENIGLTIYVKQKITKLENTATIFNPFIFYSSLDDERWILLSNKNKFIGIIRPDIKNTLYTKVCFSKWLMDVGEAKISVKQIHTIKENLYFSAFKLFVTILLGYYLIMSVNYLASKIIKY